MGALYVAAAILASAATGATIGATVTWFFHLRLAEEHHYRPYRISEATFRQLAAQADHDRRAAARWENALTQFRVIHDDIVGDLLDRFPAQPRRHPAPRSPVPDYGPHGARQ